MNYQLLAGDTLAILGADVDMVAEWTRDESGRPKGDPWRATATANAKLWTLVDDTLVEGPSFPLLTPFPVIDRFPDGRWLIAGARSNEDGNARILASNGTELRRIHLGDGIMQLKIDEAELIWVGWFDEGVFGNDAWLITGHDWPPSSYGLAAFDEYGTLVTHAVPPSPELAIADCYALNVASRTAFACTYVDFPIVSVSAAAQTWFQTDLSGTRALAVSLPYVLAAGGYSDQGDRAVLVRLDGDQGKTIKEWRLPFLLGFPERVELVDGRGETIHVVDNGMWHRWPIGSFLAAADIDPPALAPLG